MNRRLALAAAAAAAGALAACSAPAAVPGGAYASPPSAHAGAGTGHPPSAHAGVGTGHPRASARASPTPSHQTPAPAAAKMAKPASAVTAQLPGGGRTLFPGHRLVALYGHPGTPGLGVLGQQGLTASVTRARHLAAAYRPLSKGPVIPAFEIIASVAEGSPGLGGSYSSVTPVAELRPWVREATADGLYVVLDLQPGRASLLSQAEVYQSLLALPDVGLALDPEWKLQPGQKPLKQTGHIDASEANAVIGWLAALTARDHLPQKLLVIHQFRLSMISGERSLDTHERDLAVVLHMDGQGTPSVKQETWDAVTAAAPSGVSFGWKDFLAKDHPMETSKQTMAHTPAPVIITYQ